VLRMDGDRDLPSLFALTPGTQEAPNDGTKPYLQCYLAVVRRGREWSGTGIFLVGEIENIEVPGHWLTEQDLSPFVR